MSTDNTEHPIQMNPRCSCHQTENDGCKNQDGCRGLIFQMGGEEQEAQRKVPGCAVHIHPRALALVGK